MKIITGVIMGMVCLWLQAGCVGPESESYNKVMGSVELDVDAKAQTMASYDKAMLEAVTQRWFDLLEKHHFASGRATAVVQFDLYANGTISHIKLLSHQGNILLAYVCEEAIQEAAPFQPWLPGMTGLIDGKDAGRRVTFTFEHK